MDNNIFYTRNNVVYQVVRKQYDKPNGGKPDVFYDVYVRKIHDYIQAEHLSNKMWGDTSIKSFAKKPYLYACLAFISSPLFIAPFTDIDFFSNMIIYSIGHIFLFFYIIGIWKYFVDSSSKGRLGYKNYKELAKDLSPSHEDNLFFKSALFGTVLEDTEKVATIKAKNDFERYHLFDVLEDDISRQSFSDVFYYLGKENITHTETASLHTAFHNYMYAAKDNVENQLPELPDGKPQETINDILDMSKQSKSYEQLVN